MLMAVQFTWSGHCRQMAAALDGLAGTLQSGYHVDAKDLRAASASAKWVWDAGPLPAPAHAALFVAAREAFDGAIAGCSNKFPKEASIVEREAKRMARELRWMAIETHQHAPRQELPKAVAQDIHRLVSRFARNAGARAA